MGDAELFQLLDVPPTADAAAECQPFVYEVCLHRATKPFLFFRAKQNAVAALTPRAAPTARQDEPADRSRLISVKSISLRGRPRVFPLARALRSPARTRSAIRLRSNSATAPSTVKTSLPAGVDVSTCSDKLTN